MGLQYLVPTFLEAKENQRRFRECKILFETEICHMSDLADDLSRLRLYPELPKVNVFSLLCSCTKPHSWCRFPLYLLHPMVSIRVSEWRKDGQTGTEKGEI